MFNNEQNWKAISNGLQLGSFLYTQRDLSSIYYHTAGKELILVALESRYQPSPEGGQEVASVVVLHSNPDILGRCYFVDPEHFGFIGREDKYMLGKYITSIVKGHTADHCYSVWAAGRVLGRIYRGKNVRREGYLYEGKKVLDIRIRELYVQAHQ